MNLQAYKISEHQYQLYELNEHNMRLWLASFNSLQYLLLHYINCHNYTYDSLSFKGMDLTDEELKLLEDNVNEWHILIDY